MRAASFERDNNLVRMGPDGPREQKTGPDAVRAFIRDQAGGHQRLPLDPSLLLRRPGGDRPARRGEGLGLPLAGRRHHVGQRPRRRGVRHRHRDGPEDGLGEGARRDDEALPRAPQARPARAAGRRLRLPRQPDRTQRPRPRTLRRALRLQPARSAQGGHLPRRPGPRPPGRRSSCRASNPGRSKAAGIASWCRTRARRPTANGTRPRRSRSTKRSPNENAEGQGRGSGCRRRGDSRPGGHRRGDHGRCCGAMLSEPPWSRRNGGYASVIRAT